MSRSVKDCVRVFSVTIDLSRFSFRMSRFPPPFKMKQRWCDRKLEQRKWRRQREAPREVRKLLERVQDYAGGRTCVDEAAGLAFKPIDARSLKSWGVLADICFRYFQLTKTEECHNQERGKNQQCVYRRANVFVCSGLINVVSMTLHTPLTNNKHHISKKCSRQSH